MAEGPPPTLGSLLARLRNHCLETGLHPTRAQRHMAAMAVAQLFRDTGTVVKGGRNLEIRYGLRSSRASSDLDVVRAASLDAFLDDFEDALAAGWNGFGGTVRDRGAIAAPVPDAYVPRRLDVKLVYRGRSGVGTVSVEVAVEEAAGLAAVESATSHDANDLFSAVGLPGPDPVPLLPVPVQIAQKLHACTTPDDPARDWGNDRAHYLVDLQLLAGDVLPGQLVQVRDAATRLFAARQRHPWPPEIIVREGWEVLYDRELTTVAEPRVALANDVHTAASWANELVAAVDAAR